MQWDFRQQCASNFVSTVCVWLLCLQCDGSPVHQAGSMKKCAAWIHLDIDTPTKMELNYMLAAECILICFPYRKNIEMMPLWCIQGVESWRLWSQTKTNRVVLFIDCFKHMVAISYTRTFAHCTDFMYYCKELSYTFRIMMKVICNWIFQHLKVILNLLKNLYLNTDIKYFFIFHMPYIFGVFWVRESAWQNINITKMSNSQQCNSIYKQLYIR